MNFDSKLGYAVFCGLGGLLLLGIAASRPEWSLFDFVFAVAGTVFLYFLTTRASPSDNSGADEDGPARR